MSSLDISQVSESLQGIIQHNEHDFDAFVAQNTGRVDDQGQFIQSADGTLILSAGASLEMQERLGTHGIIATTTSQVMKAIKDSSTSAVHNI